MNEPDTDTAAPGFTEAPFDVPSTLDTLLGTAPGRRLRAAHSVHQAQQTDQVQQTDQAHQAHQAHQAQLSRVVELDIIPRLLLLHRMPHSPAPPVHAAGITDDDVQALAERAVNGAPDSTLALVMRLIGQGVTHEQVLLDLLAPAARWMGRLWEDDHYSFSQVTIGLWRLQRVLHELAQPAMSGTRHAGDSRSVLLAAVPGSQHTFGVAMVAEFFSRDGWDVACEPCVDWVDLRSRVAARHFDVFGLSVSASQSVLQVASAILDIRRASANPQLYVMVGGPMAAQMPDLCQRCGADAMACDAPSAVVAANSSLRQRVKAM